MNLDEQIREQGKDLKNPRMMLFSGYVTISLRISLQVMIGPISPEQGFGILLAESIAKRNNVEFKIYDLNVGMASSKPSNEKYVFAKIITEPKDEEEIKIAISLLKKAESDYDKANKIIVDDVLTKLY
jgi:hypothetical protein